MAKNVKIIQATSPILSAQSQISVKKRRVAAYARVSTEKDEQQNSYEAQIEYYTRYIQSNPEWIFAGIFSDEGITGTSIKRRDGFNKMIETALAGEIDLIITKSVSRFARNTVDTAFNHVLARKEEIAANYAECLDAITDDSALQTRMETIQLETSDLTTLINNLLVSGSKQRGSNEDINKRYEEYMSRHEALQQEKLELSKQISLLAAKRLLVNAFLSELAKFDGPLTVFDPLVFQATVNYVTVRKDCAVTFLFRDGTEVTETIQKGVKPYVRRKTKPDGNISEETDGDQST